MEINETFHDGDDYTTVSPVYFSFDQLLDKLGPVRNRKDVDSLFFHLYYVSTNAQSGARTARKLVDSGYDINFVLPTFHHPIFGAIAAEAFKVARELVELGTRADHVDRKGVSVVDRLNEALAWWKNRLEEHKKGDSIYGMAKRRIDQIEETHAALPDASR